MQLALTEPAVRRVALYEPPLPISGSSPSSKEWLPRFDREIAEGKLVAALVTGLRGIKISPLFSLASCQCCCLLSGYAAKAKLTAMM
jgi:hypothetical protein